MQPIEYLSPKSLNCQNFIIFFFKRFVNKFSGISFELIFSSFFLMLTKLYVILKRVFLNFKKKIIFRINNTKDSF